MTIRLGITGGIGSGKSVVARLLEVMGVPVYISDKESKRLMLADPCIRQGLTSLLGDAVYENGKLNKQLVASYLFSSPKHAQRVNGIVHPRVKADFARWTRKYTRLPVVGIETAILLECGFADVADKVAVVSAPLEMRIARAMARDHASRMQIEERIRSQMDDDEKRKRADFVIENDGKTPLIPQLAALLAALAPTPSGPLAPPGLSD